MRTLAEQRAAHANSSAALNQAINDLEAIKQKRAALHDSVPPEWIKRPNATQSKKADARRVLGQDEPATGKRYDKYRADLAKLKEAEAAAKQRQKECHAAVQVERHLLDGQEARDAASVSLTCAAFAELYEAMSQLHAYDPVRGSSSLPHGVDRDAVQQRAQDAFDFLIDQSEDGWP